MEEDWAAIAMRQPRESGTSPALFGELGWGLRLWSRVQIEALAAEAMLRLAPAEYDGPRVLLAWQGVSGTWAKACVDLRADLII